MLGEHENEWRMIRNSSLEYSPHHHSESGIFIPHESRSIYVCYLQIYVLSPRRPLAIVLTSCCAARRVLSRG